MIKLRAATLGLQLLAVTAGLFGCDSDASSAGGGGAQVGDPGGGGQGGQGGQGGSAEPAAPDPTGFVKTTAMSVARAHHTATLLADGKVLVVGGDDASYAMQDAVELFDPSGETWAELPPLPEARSNHTATLLADGRVLIAGGGTTSAIGLPNGVVALDSAVLFDPATGAYQEVGPMTAKRADHRAQLLGDGRVLLVGGASDTVAEECTVIPNCTVGVALDSAEIFDPSDESFTATGSLNGARYSAVAATLDDGRVLVAGGVDSFTSVATAEIFDPAAAVFSLTAEMQYERLFAAGALLGSGKLLIAGGKKADVAPHAHTELYDAGADSWTKVAELSQARTGAQAVTLQSGRVLHIGGYNQIAQTAVTDVELFDEATNAWTLLGELTSKRSLHTATLLGDGRVLACGGFGPLGPAKTCDLSVSD